MNRILHALVAFVACLLPALLHAQDKYPSRPLRIIVPFVPGGVGDTLARIISTPLSAELGKPVIVENRAGNSGMMGTEYAAKTSPDGYTVLQASTPQIINMVLADNVRYDMLKDFTPVLRAVNTPLVLVVPAALPVRTPAELVAHAKSGRGELTYGSGGVGSVGHLSGELFKRTAGISALHVAYKGNAAVIPDLVGGRLHFFFASQPEAVQGITAGHLRAIAVTAPQRVPTLPDVPTMNEAGFANFDVSSNYGYVLPANTPASIVEQLQKAITKVVATPSVQERLRSVGLIPNVGGPEEMRATLKSEIERWGSVVKASGIRSE